MPITQLHLSAFKFTSVQLTIFHYLTLAISVSLSTINVKELSIRLTILTAVQMDLLTKSTKGIAFLLCPFKSLNNKVHCTTEKEVG